MTILYESEEWKEFDWDGRESKDQKEIREYLDTIPLSNAFTPQGTKLLHIGIGNSALAKDFYLKVKNIVGVCVTDKEVDYANSLEFRKYKIYNEDKHNPELQFKIVGTFDYIIDNNLNSYACNYDEFLNMIDNYYNLLKPNGKIITHTLGLNYIFKGCGVGPMKKKDLEKLKEFYNFKIEEPTKNIITLQKVEDED